MSARPSRIRFLLGLLAALFLGSAALYVLSSRPFGLPPMGTLLDPVDGLYRTARGVPYPDSAHIDLPALEAPVTVVRDERGVPHLFAQSNRDAVIALGYVTVQDRLFQMDFVTRVASGRLAEAVGPQAVPADRFLRQTGMAWGARNNLRRIRREKGIEWKLLNWYAAGVNAWIDGLSASELPVEFRLLGYRPDRYTPLDGLLLLQYMTYDLTWATDDPRYALLRRRLGAQAFRSLYPRRPYLYVPIIRGERERGKREERRMERTLPSSLFPLPHKKALSAWRQISAFRKTLRGTAAEGFIPGKGSNNWAVAGTRSTTHAPLLAGDMHLSLSLPAVWYEAHLVTPTMNLYGVTIPGAPLIVEGFNDHVAWAFTNTGADVIDHFALMLDSTGTRYRYEGAWRPIETRVDTIYVNGAVPVLDTLDFSHWGPVFKSEWPEVGAVALRWVAHDTSRTLRALWEMNHATDAGTFEAALRYWDTPMQNILYATADGTIAIRSTGYLPIRRGGSGAGLLDGSTDASAWTGRVPFAALPHAQNPPRGYLTSTNQPAADTSYAYYLGYRWRVGWRSLRIDSLLSGQAQQGVEDFMRYQRDVHAVQHEFLVSLLDTLSVSAGQGRTGRLRRMLTSWNGETAAERPEPLVLDEILKTLQTITWDEPVFEGVPRPNLDVLLMLLEDQPRSRWLDIDSTAAREGAAALLRRVLMATADTLARKYGWGADHWRWGAHHQVIFRHLTGAEALRPLWRGPFAYPGFDATLSPAGQRPTVHGASWRMIVDFSKQPPRAWGIYPGGQSGNPFSALYDRHLPTYLAFEYYALRRPDAPEAVKPARSYLTLMPR